MHEPEAIIRTDNLTKRFGSVTAVEGLNLSIARGEIFGLIGPDGSGKTTTIRLLAAIMPPSAGRATVAGFDTVTQAEQIRRLVGYMPQRFSLYGDLSVLENLSFFADVFGVRGRERRERINRLLHFARLTEFRQRRAAHLSGGMQKKLALACTLIHRPQVLFLDEPTTGVDPISRREFWDILSGLHLEGVTLFVSTPYMDEAERCARVGLMYEGRLMVCERPEQIKALVPGQLLALRTPQLAQARAAVTPLPGVLEVQTYGDLLHIFVDDAATRRSAIEARLAEAGLPVISLQRARPRLEEAFISLIRRRLEEDGTRTMQGVMRDT
ncbi:MAG: ABC transporter ATP-binding protein [Anaerolineae bacterium]|nr:ABC transporter ATP-binding protein [Anaerolineae bacterium]